jgi:hypothetical protein
MKTIQKTILPLILASGLMLTSSFSKVSTKSAQVITEPGEYKTYDDYVKHQLTRYDAISIGHGGFKGTLNGKKVPNTSYKDADVWGLQNDNGVIYRINKKANLVDQVIGGGKIFYYAGTELIIKRNFDGSVKDMVINADDGQNFSDLFWVSEGGEGDMIKASLDNLSALFADSPALVEKMKAKGIDEKHTKNWLDNFYNVNGWINEYNKAHQ